MAHLRVRTAERDLHSGVYGGVGAERRARAHADARRTSCPAPTAGCATSCAPGCATPSADEVASWAELPAGAGVLAEAGAHGDRAGRGRASSTRAPGRTRASTSTASRAATRCSGRTIIPCTASARLSVRVAPRPGRRGRSRAALERILREAAPPGAEIELDVEPGEPAGFDAADPVLALAREAIGARRGQRARCSCAAAARSRSSARSRDRGIPTVLSGFALDADGIHGPDESYRLESLALGERAARELYAALATLARAEADSRVGGERRLDALARDQLDAVGGRARPSARDPRRARTARAPSRRGRARSPARWRPMPQRTRPKSRVPSRSATRAQAVVAAQAAAQLRTHLPEARLDVVVHADDLIGPEAVGAHGLLHRPAREVHEPQRAQQRDGRAVLEPHLAERAAVLLALGRRVPAREPARPRPGSRGCDACAA